MSKIQILNETQVKHFVEALLPELETKFDLRKKELKEQAEKEKDNFATHAEIIELKEKQEQQVEKAKKTIKLYKELQSIDENYNIRHSGYNTVYYTEEMLEELLKDQKEILSIQLMHLSEANLNVNNSYTRFDQMKNDLVATLSMTAVATFDEIKTHIISSIDIDSYFSYTI